TSYSLCSRHNRHSHSFPTRRSSDLHDFRPTPQVKVLGKALYDRKTHVVHPEWTIGNSPPLLALAPADFAVQYDLNPLYAAGIDRSEEHTSELQSHLNLVCRLLLEKK